MLQLELQITIMYTKTLRCHLHNKNHASLNMNEDNNDFSELWQSILVLLEGGIYFHFIY